MREEAEVGRGNAALLDAREARLPAGHPWTQLPLVGVGVAVAGVALLALASGAGPRRVLAAWLVALVYFLTIALGCLYFVLIHTAMQGAWGVVVRRVAEAAASTLPVFALLFVPLALGLADLYPWAHATEDALVQWKKPYLNEAFFLARAAGYLAVWSAAAVWFARLSRRQDASADPSAIAARLRRWSGPLLIPVGLAHTFAAFDWLMSLDPHWYSTIFGVYSFAGSLLAGFAFLAVAAVLLRRSGLLPLAVSAEHLHDLGKLLFAFTAFWAYIAFSQFFLIWYANIPEETIWYHERLSGSWAAMSALLAIGHFAVPFLFLLPRRTKRNPLALAAAAVWLLLMHFVDVYWLVLPSVHGVSHRPGLADAGALLAVGGTALAAFALLLRRHPLVPVGDPRLAESLAFENV
jgi:hypothetical protein